MKARNGKKKARPMTDEECANWRPTYNGSGEDDRSDAHEPIIVSLATVKPQPVEWLWKGKIPIGKVSLFIGDPGLGKSFITLDMGARVSRGAPWPDEPNVYREPGGVVLLSAEDDLADTIRPRLDAAGADCNRIVALEAIRTPDKQERGFDITQDVHHLRRAIEQTKGVRLVVIDPITAYMGKTDSHKNAEVRSALAPIRAMAAELRFAVLLVSHLRKGEGPAVYRSTGSLAFTAAARCVWCAAKDQTGQRRLFLPVKSNIGNDRDGLTYSLMSWGSGDTPFIAWGDVSTVSADEALASGKPHGPKPEARTDAEAWLLKALAKGGRLGAELEDEAKESEGITKGTLGRAKRRLKVVSYRPENPGPWWWKLPEANDGKAAGAQCQAG